MEAITEDLSLRKHKLFFGEMESENISIYNELWMKILIWSVGTTIFKLDF